jgi:hypothetical protein
MYEFWTPPASYNRILVIYTGPELGGTRIRYKNGKDLATITYESWGYISIPGDIY